MHASKSLIESDIFASAEGIQTNDVLSTEKMSTAVVAKNKKRVLKEREMKPSKNKSVSESLCIETNEAKLENEYQKKEHVEHIYDIPDTYTGSIEMTEQMLYVMQSESSVMEKESILFVPGLFKIFDEILVNAVDHKQRDPNLKNIKINFGKGMSEITVWNDGKGIDVERHPIYNEYIVEMLFSQLLTSTNYDKEQKKTTGGKNGYGAKLTNIFSKKFVVETVDAVRKKKYTQVFENNMKIKHEPVITKSLNKPYTSVTFLPDYEKFECAHGITDGIFKLFEKRVYDISGSISEDVNVYLNGEKLKVKGFEKYVQLYIQSHTKYTDTSQERWKVGVCLSNEEEGFSQVSFVNGIWTMKGGKHVDHVCGLLIDRLKDLLSKNGKTKNRNIKNSVIRDSIFLFVNCIIENPSFTSQTKEELSSKVSQFGSSWVVCDKLVERFFKGGFLDRMMEHCTEKEEKNMKKTDGNKKSQIRVPKLEDANFAGTKRSMECTLILTEGDSAKTSALSGLSVHGPSFRDRFGIFPLKGKFLNVRDASVAQILNNEEVKNLKKILGLQQGKEYTKDNIKELRYGSVSLMTDQDSVAWDTPILLSLENERETNQSIYVSEVCNLFETKDSFTLENGKEICILRQDLYAWTNVGWSKVLKIIRHKVSKKMYRVITPRGIVDVTEDHSLLNADGEKISPKLLLSKIKEGAQQDTKLLYSFPFENSFREDKDEDGQVGPTVIYKKSKYDAQMVFLLETIKGNQVTIDYDENKAVYILRLNSDIEYEAKILELKNVTEQNKGDKDLESDNGLDNEQDQYVYDLETENHQFQAGIGEMIVHNTDGSHIKGLILNFFHHFFPSLLKVDGFLKSYITPIVRGFKGKESKNFYTISDYEKFKKTPESQGFSFKYYKGLGTSTSSEMQQYFKKLSDITINYEYTESTDAHINMAFRKSMSQERKDWLKIYDSNDTIVYSSKKGTENMVMNEFENGVENEGRIVTIEDFVHKELKHFSNYDNIRSIPNIMDGLKPSQRKVMYGSFCKFGNSGGHTNTAIKVAQLSGYISEKTCYHHGEASLEQTIIGLAQKFVGKNNINWLEPVGMFGTRLMGGKDHASARYIFTRIQELTFKTFRAEDNILLEYQDDDGDIIEPVNYYPIIPVVLLNGCEGIGTGYSTTIPAYCPLKIVEACRYLASGEKTLSENTEKMFYEWTPWYDGFKGIIEKKATQKQSIQTGNDESLPPGGDGTNTFINNHQGSDHFVSEGVFCFLENENKVVVSELPVGVWTENYKEFLEEQVTLYLEWKKKKMSPSSQGNTGNTGNSGNTGMGNGEKDDGNEKNANNKSENVHVSLNKILPITSFNNLCTDDSVLFEIYFDDECEIFLNYKSWTKNEWVLKLKIFSHLSNSNMYLYVENELKKFDKVYDIIVHFSDIRIKKYKERKAKILQILNQELAFLNEKIRFLEMVIFGQLVIFKRPKDEIVQEMKEKGFLLKDDKYDYCIKLPIDSFCLEKLQNLMQEKTAVEHRVSSLESKSANEIWMEELDDWVTTYKKIYRRENKEASSAKKAKDGENQNDSPESGIVTTSVKGKGKSKRMSADNKINTKNNLKKYKNGEN